MNHRYLTATLSFFAFHFHASAKELEGVYKPAQNECPSVEEAIKKMKVPDGYEVRNFASEPMIINPVAMTWDHRGRLWVVELYEYPKGAKTPNEYSKIATDEKFRPVVKTNAESPRDRVIILEDTDNDGKADKRTVFAEGLNLATGILCGYDGVFVGQAPNLFFFRDTNGDDKADEYKTVLTGFGLEDRHELLNSFTWGPDGWLYMTHGVFTHSKVRRPEQKPEEGFKLDAGIFRVKISNHPSDRSDRTDTSRSDPRAAAYEVYADGTSNPWGVDFDARGNAFVSACVIDHLFHMAPGGLYQRQGGAPENPYAYELLPSIVDFKHFRAAYAGIQIYQGGIYPPDTHGHLFIGNIHDNAIHEESLTPVGATFKAAPVRDFLRANDGWFRPVSTQTGPDGFLWIMDWCDKYPCYQNAQANPEGVDRAHGRIWRVCYTGSEAGKKLTGQSRFAKDIDYKKTEDSFLGYLSCTAPTSWARGMAIRMLVERNGGNALKILEAFAKGEAFVPKEDADEKELVRQGYISPDADTVQLQSLRTLTACGLLTEPLLDSKFLRMNDDVANLCLSLRFELLLADKCANRPDFCKTLERQGSVSTVEEATVYARGLRRLTSASLTLSKPLDWKRDPIGPDDMLFELLNSVKFPDDRTLWFHIWQAFEPILASDPARGLLLAELVLDNKNIARSFTYKTARRITDTRKPENMDLLLAFLNKLKDDDVLTAHALDGMLKAQEAGAVKPAKTDPAPFFARWAASKSADVRNHAGRLATLWGDKAAVTALIKVAEDPKADAAQRAEAIRTLRKLDSDEARAALLRILEKSLPQ